MSAGAIFGLVGVARRRRKLQRRDGQRKKLNEDRRSYPGS
jgi:hypothetical protein